MSRAPRHHVIVTVPSWFARCMVVVFAVVAMAATLAWASGSFAADGAVKDSTAKPTDAAAPPVNLAGRWTGPTQRSTDMIARAGCENGCPVTFDIVACDTGWCGIDVPADKPCGGVALRIQENAEKSNSKVTWFEGKLERAKGAAEFVVQASYLAASPGPSDGTKAPMLRVFGDTGPAGMLFMRRSFPFQAELARSGDAQCTLEKATS